MKISEAIQRVQSIYSKGVQSDDTRLSPAHIYSKLNSVKNDIILKLLFKNGISQLDIEFYTHVKNAKIEEFNRYQDIGYDLKDCNLYSTVCDIPNVLGNSNSFIIKNVTSSDGSIIFSETNRFLINHLKEMKYVGKLPYYFYFDKKMFFVNVGAMKQVDFFVVFNDVVNDYWLNTCLNNTCVDIFEKDFPAPNKYMEQIIEIAVNEFIHMLSIPDDKLNDSSEMRYIKPNNNDSKNNK